jgi:site-specific DNA recombinase
MSSFFMYVRKSTEETDRQAASIPAQLSELHAFASSRGLTISRVFEESQSARHTGRPVFGEMMREADRHHVEGILCWKADRLARNALDGGRVIDALDRHRLGSIVTPGRTFHDTSDDKLMLNLEFGMSKKYVDDLSDNIRRGNRAVLASGRSTGIVPLGYVKEPPADRTHGRGAGRTIRDPERFELVNNLFRRALTGTYTLSDLHRIARDELGVRSRGTRRYPAAPLGITTVYQMFSNPFYMGLVRHGGDVFPGTHEPMVTKAEFETIQTFLHRGNRPRPSSHAFTYRGLLSCVCGRGVTAEIHTKRSGLHFTYYHCSRRRKDPAVCPRPFLAEAELERVVAETFEALAVPAQYVRWALARIGAMEKKADDTATAAHDALRKELASKESELDRLTALCVQGRLTGDEFMKAKTRMLGERMEIEARLADPKPEATALRRLRETIIAAADAPRGFKEAKPDERRRLVSELCEVLEVGHGGLEVRLLPPFATLAGYTATKGSNSSLATTNSNADGAKHTRGISNRVAPRRRSCPEGSNPRRTSRESLNQTKNRVVAGANPTRFSAWWTRVLQVRTLLTQSGGTSCEQVLMDGPVYTPYRKGKSGNNGM